MMSKYDRLSAHLRGLSAPEWTARFDEIEAILGFPLPASALAHRPWWANRSEQNGSQCLGWQNAGWETADVDMQCKTVRFINTGRMPKGSSQTTARMEIGNDGGLIAQAKKLLSEGLGISADKIEITIRA